MTLEAPWYIYIVAVLVALPCYILWGVGAWGILRSLVSWIFAAETPKPGVGSRGVSTRA